MDPWNTKSCFRPSAWKALTGGWWLTCSDRSLKPRSSLETEEAANVSAGGRTRRR